MVFLDEINNRELAILFWSAVFIVTSLLSDKRGAIVRAFLGVVRALCNKKIISYIIMSALYSAACVVLISMIGIWSHDNVKDTLVWYFIVGLYPLFRYRDMQEDVWASLKRLAVDGLGFSAIIGFVANFYTFQLWFEFIVFVPISIFMAIFIAVVESDKSVTIEIRQVMNVMVIIGLSMFVYSLYAILCDLSSFASKETFYSFVCPVMLTVMYLPFLYLFVLLVVYESVFTTINANIHDQYLARKMKWYAIIRYKFSARLLARWNKWIWQIRNFEDAIKSIDEIFAMAKREKAQLPIDLSEGWSPYTSRLFLEDFKIKTGNYDLRYDDVWGASSPAIHVCGCGCLVKSKYSGFIKNLLII